MAVISDDTFDPLRRYVRVRLQQGVPIVDADVNEREDVQAFELRAFLKWFVGDGVPEGNDGFRVEGTGADGDFTVATGFTGTVDGLRNVGRCLVEGLDVIITEEATFKGQPLHESRAGAAELAKKWKVDVVGALPVPRENTTVLVYLDVWERLVTPAEDDKLKHPALGVESCARMKREWVVRVAPDPPDHKLPKPAAGHAHAPLAAIRRRKDDAVVRPTDVVDRRAQRLLVPPATLVEDVLGLGADVYRTGAGRPPISLRNAINALLRGELPGTLDAAVSTSASLDTIGRAFLVDGAGGLVAVWSSSGAAAEQVFAGRLSLAHVGAGFGEPVAVTTEVRHGRPTAALLPTGDLLVAYETGFGASGAIRLKRAADVAGLAGAGETVVADTPSVNESAPHVVATGNLVTVFFHKADPGAEKWHYRVRRADGTFAGAAAPLSATVTTLRDFHAAAAAAPAPDQDPAPDDTVWAAFRAGDDIRVLQLDPASGTLANEETINSGQADEQPFVLRTRSRDVWLFWKAADGLRARRFRGAAWGPIEQIPGSVVGDQQPCAVEDVEGGIWLIWTTGTPGSGEIVALRRHPVLESWDVRGGVRQLVTAPKDDSSPFALVAPDTAIWLFWSTDRTGSMDVFFKQLVTKV